MTRLEKAEWCPLQKCWQVPLEMHDEVVRMLLGLRGVQVAISNLHHIPASVIQAASGSPDDSARYESLPKKLKEQLMDFQREGVRFALRRGGKVLVGDEMGLGKTVQAIAIMSLYREEWPCLIITPSSLREQWADALHQWLGITDEKIRIIYSGKDCELSLRGIHFLILSYNFVGKMKAQLTQLAFKVVVLDESHYIKDQKAQRTKDTIPLVQKARRAVLLTGTPALSRPIELYTQLTALVPKAKLRKADYGERYCGGHNPRDQYNKFQGASNHDELYRLLTGTVMVRRLKKDVLTQLPEKRRQQVFLRLEGKELAQLKAVKTQMDKAKAAAKAVYDSSDLGELDGVEEVQAAGGGAGSGRVDAMRLISEMYQKTAELKDKVVRDYVAELLDNDQKFLIFAHHECLLNSIETAVRSAKAKHIRIDGKVAPRIRQQLVDTFQQTADCKVAILSIMAAGTGLTLTAASIVVFAEMTWVPGNLVQAEDRAHRIGQGSRVNVYYLHVKGSIDDIIWESVQNKLEHVGQVLNGAQDRLEVASQHHKPENGQTSLSIFEALAVSHNGSLSGSSNCADSADTATGLIQRASMWSARPPPKSDDNDHFAFFTVVVGVGLVLFYLQKTKRTPKEEAKHQAEGEARKLKAAQAKAKRQTEAEERKLKAAQAQCREAASSSTDTQGSSRPASSSPSSSAAVPPPISGGQQSSRPHRTGSWSGREHWQPRQRQWRNASSNEQEHAGLQEPARQRPHAPGTQSLEPVPEPLTRPLSHSANLQVRMDELLARGHFREAVQQFEEYMEQVRGTEQGSHPDYRPTTWAWNSYAMALQRSRARVVKMRDMLKMMEEDFNFVPRISIFNSVLKRCEEWGAEPGADPEAAAGAAWHVLADMKVKGVAPNLNSYFFAVRAASRRRDSRSAVRLLRMLQATSWQLDKEFEQRTLRRIYVSVILACARTRRLDDCMMVVADMQKDGIRVPAAALVEIFMYAVELNRSDVLLAVLREISSAMQRQSVTADPHPLKVDEGSLLAGLELAAQTGDVELGQECWAVLQRSLELPFQHLARPRGSSYMPQRRRAVDSSSSSSESDDELASTSGRAAAPVQQAQQRKQLPSVSSYHAFIHTMAAANDIKQAFQAIGELQAAYPDNPLATAYSPALAMVVDALAVKVARQDEAYYALEEMKERGETITTPMANCIIAACAQVGELPRAFETFEALATLGLQPDSNTFNAILQGCLLHGQVDSVPKVLEEMQSLGLMHNRLTHELIMQSHIVTGRTRELVAQFKAMLAAGFQPGIQIMDRAISRCERVGDREGIATFIAALDDRNFKTVGIMSKLRRWREEGGIHLLTGLDSYVPRDHSPRYFHPIDTNLGGEAKAAA
ncbi:hypothetical protein WJX72_005876 [[Myrmecia] bisecta]|uniref:Uncharacterized protein n=1 Tax=[Myrmecia] bisecta TaxID=41462 RepID=A0AAW1PYJ5_9CHLO